MRTKKLALLCFPVAAATLLAAVPLSAGAETFRTTLDGYQVVSTVSTSGKGSFRAKIDPQAMTIHYDLSYQDLEGDILQSHIHLGRPGTNGGIFLFLCTNLGNDPAVFKAPTCPGPRSGSVSRTVGPSEIVSFAGVDVQGIAAGEFDEVVKALEAGAGYVVVHTSLHPPGELRGNIRGKGKDHD